MLQIEELNIEKLVFRSTKKKKNIEKLLISSTNETWYHNETVNHHISGKKPTKLSRLKNCKVGP